MAAYTPVSAVSQGLVSVLQDSTFQTLCPGGVWDSVPQAPTYPFVLYAITEQAQFGGFGTKPGVGALPEVEIRLHAFSQFGGLTECQSVIARAIALVTGTGALQAAGVPGYQVCGAEPFLDRTVPLPDEAILGQKVTELVAFLRVYVQEQ